MGHVDLKHDRLTHSIIGAFYDVYNALGYGFLERFYVAALERELKERGHQVGREVSVPVFYRGQEIGRQRVDMIVDAAVVVETKAGQELQKFSARQLYNYLRATRLEVGLLLHFGPEPYFDRLYCRPKFSARIGSIPPHPKHPHAPRLCGPSGR